jgi:hypothetical protein
MARQLEDALHETSLAVKIHKLIPDLFGLITTSVTCSSKYSS